MSKKLLVSIFLVLLFHIVGLIGMMGDHPSFFIRNTPFNLLLSAALLFWNQDEWKPIHFLALLIIYSGGFLAEVIGTGTGLLFGNYWYGKTLGWKLWDVPVIIGMNWIMMIYLVGNLFIYMSLSIWKKSALAALLLVLLDYFMEPVAMSFDYWQWENATVPVTNYICWYFISFLFLSLFFKAGFRKYNPLSAVLFFMQLLMFVVLYFKVR